MALGSVSISTFIPGELEDLTGAVSIIPFTRAEIERLANKKAYPDGKLVWSANVNASSTTNVPDDVDYITISVGDSPIKVARGGSAQWTSITYYGSLSSPRKYTVYHTAKYPPQKTNERHNRIPPLSRNGRSTYSRSHALNEYPHRNDHLSSQPS